MKNTFLTLAIVFVLTLSACQKENPQETSSEVANHTPAESSESENDVKNDCLISEIPEGKWCYTHQSDFSILLPSDFEIYGQEGSGNFIAPDKNNFIHIGYFPLQAFHEDAQKLLKEGKLKEYMEYEQENVCKPNPQCTSVLNTDSFADLKLGNHQFLKYQVEVNNPEKPFKSTHYSAIIDDSFVDFSTSEGEMVPNPPLSENLVESKYLDEKAFEEIMSTLAFKKD